MSRLDPDLVFLGKYLAKPNWYQFLVDGDLPDHPFQVDNAFSSSDIICDWSPHSERCEVWKEAVAWGWERYDRVKNIDHMFFFKNAEDAVEFKLRFSK